MIIKTNVILINSMRGILSRFWTVSEISAISQLFSTILWHVKQSHKMISISGREQKFNDSVKEICFFADLNFWGRSRGLFVFFVFKTHTRDKNKYQKQKFVYLFISNAFFVFFFLLSPIIFRMFWQQKWVNFWVFSARELVLEVNRKKKFMSFFD